MYISIQYRKGTSRNVVLLFDSHKNQTEFIGLLPSGAVVDVANFEELAFMHGDHMNKVKYLNVNCGAEKRT